MVYIQRRETFSASHRLYNAAWSDDQNEAVFGKCSNRFGHGHNFQLIVTVKGEVNPDTGFVMNLVDLKTIMMHEIIDHVDHRNLNEDVPFLQGVLPSTENLAIAFWARLAPAIAAKGAQLHGIRIVETENNFVEYYGE
ncbi:MAG: 6-carboxytetrahydropterin synthase [Bacteroidetes bacterium]|jgi:6-pyruvoyltetrahydropterin/6-carboxytetrahydropterin synthase|nr:MAG: 6-pyruvoyl tetrahydrobiopterin synthase [Cryomorphaceae bacterium BACL23 MAG-120924-bin60]MBL6627313.1 6-carboxytetrahydropterin synthase [Cryomorphaceae bacterium]MDA0363412.1 6-carboxytetrahydropterin synthase [Bacteroidota bacterium]MDA0829200.1 6-carboxytetrahydropterin synthase [Bacteroidota bacterium]MDA1199411.1 6-carboxytetrahydropterin synthase [Bacteroidota bacterium]